MLSSLISKFIVALLALGLVISLGVGSDFVNFGMSENVVAEINNSEISKEEIEIFEHYFGKGSFSDSLDLDGLEEDLDKAHPRKLSSKFRTAKKSRGWLRFGPNKNRNHRSDEIYIWKNIFAPPGFEKMV